MNDNIEQCADDEDFCAVIEATAHGPLTAGDISLATGLPVMRVLEIAHRHWWEIESRGGDGGFRYSQRKIETKAVREQPTMYDDSGLSKNDPFAKALS